MADDEHEGASVQEQLVEACRRNNTDLLTEVLAGRSEEAAAKLLNETVTVLGNHLYHEAASQGNYEIIDLLLDQPGFECDPISRRERDTPLHTAIRWSNSEPPAQQPFAQALIEMMLEAGSNPRIKNKAGLTATQLVDPRYPELRQIIEKHEYALLNAGDFVDSSAPNAKSKSAPKVPASSAPPLPPGAAPALPSGGAPPIPSYDDDDAEFSGSDEDERAEWERQRRK
ncbi:ankyrin repeat protein [Ophiostoma piceae UAMH 11346]|uniref:Ankyrin repeat protein n=1 Tax=Ophiostoma piceae (strain UAMH 11346) TaxID=1262450 RepID=S3C870_OPHP1|nr:ankyrin repeat protein [Ophiostoma piceae UAMH 11346]